MEEEESKMHGETSGRGPEADKERGSLDDRALNSHEENDRISSADIISNTDLQGQADDGLFEAVSLKDQDKREEGADQSHVLDSLRHSSGESEDTFEFSFGKIPSGFNSPPDAEIHHDRHLSSPGPERESFHQFMPSPSSSLDSALYSYGESGYSPADSPQKPMAKQVMPNVAPELLHLVDSAIMGKPESLDKLKHIVSGIDSFGDGEEPENIAFLVVDSLLATMGGVESFEEDEDTNPPSVMLNSRAAIVAGELIPWFPCVGDIAGLMSPRTRMVRGLLAILRACTRNRAMCSIAGLLGVLLRSAEKIFLLNNGSHDEARWDGAPLCYCIQHLAGHSLSVSDLRRWFEVITATIQTKWAVRLLLSLEKAMGGKESKGPASTFEFDGESSGLLGPGESRWPFTNGYAFATWIYIESFADTLNTATAAAAIAAAAAATAGKSSAMSAAAAASALAGEGTAHMPRLFSFLSADNQGMEAYFHAQFLVVEIGSGKGRKASLHFTHAFKPQCWYFVGLEHTSKQGLLGKTESELRLYIDGSLYESRLFDFPRISKPLAFCCIGTNPPPTMAGLQRRRRQCPLFAEMGPVYIFREAIGPEKMRHLASRGGDVLPSFGTGAGLPWLATNEHLRKMAEESARLDAEIAGSLHLLYHPNLLNGRYCPDASPSGTAGIYRRPAEVLGQVHVANRMRPAEALWALAYGGPMSLLPLAVCNVHENSLEPSQGDNSLSLATTALAAPIFRIITLAIQYPGNVDELCRRRGPEVLSRVLNYLLQTLSSLDAAKRDGVVDEELVAAIVSLCQSQKQNHALKVQLFSTLLLDLKIWSLCSYGLQKKLLSSLADMVFTESAVMRDANAIQMLLDGCRRCYWITRENDSVDMCMINEATRPIGEINALVDELLVVIELLVVAAPPSLAIDDVRCLLGFMVDCPQRNQVARILHLIYRLVVQPNASRAQTFAEAFISGGGVETLLVLLQREAKAGDHNGADLENDKSLDMGSEGIGADVVQDNACHENVGHMEETKFNLNENSNHESWSTGNSVAIPVEAPIQRMSSVSENPFLKNLGGISFSISAENARNNVYNADKSDGIVVSIINLLGTLVISGHLKFDIPAPPDMTNNILGFLEGGGTMFDDKVSLLLFALQKAFQAAPNRLMTSRVYTALLGASINATPTDDGLNFYDSGHRFEHLQLLLVLLRSLPFASMSFQSRALQDLLILACSHPENRSRLTTMEEWPEWILEILISNYEMGVGKAESSASVKDVEDLIHNFLIIMLEHSMRRKDGWQDIEATIHCAEWLSMVGGSSTGDQRIRREESLPIFKRRLLGSLLDFAARELQVQTQVIAAAAAGVAAEGLHPKDAKVEAENAAQLSVALVENAIVILMLVEDHLRLQSKLYTSTRFPAVSISPLSNVLPLGNRSSAMVGGPLEAVPEHKTLSGDSGGLPLDVLASMADANGQISAAVMERLTAAAAAEPYESVSCAFVSYGSCAMDLAAGWKYRSRLWYGVGLPSKTSDFGGGGSGWDTWKSVLEKDSNGEWIELPLIRKSVCMLQALLLDDSGLGGGLGIGGGSGTGMGGMAALYQLLDSDQPFLCMLRMVLASLREEDDGKDNMLTGHVDVQDGMPKGLHRQSSNLLSFEVNARLPSRKPRSSLLWSVLSPILNMPISESKRQRVLVASCLLYSEVWHAVSRDKAPIRKHYLETIVPPFVAVLRRWRPLLAGIYELATADGVNPLVTEDRALAADALPIEAALAMISPSWAAAFASPPAAMGLAMIAAGAAGGEVSAPVSNNNTHLRRDSSLLERKTARLHTFSSFQKPLDAPSKSPAVPKDKAAAKAAALAAARDLERSAKIGSGRGLSAVAMATSAQRRSKSDTERVKRWNVSEAMGTAWMECLQSIDTKSVYGKDFNALSYKYIAVLVGSLALARNMQRLEVDRRIQVDLVACHRLYTGIREWRKLIHYLIEMKCLFGPFGSRLSNPERIFWKLDFTESSYRMRRCFRRNYQGSDHFGASANYDDTEQTRDSSSSMSPSKASIVAAEAILTEVMNDDDEQDDTTNMRPQSLDVEQKGGSQTRMPETADLPLQTSVKSEDAPVIGNQDLVEDQSPVAPGYIPSERDERIVLELPSSMIRPLKILRGTFQITTRKLNFIVDNNEKNACGDGLDCRNETRIDEKDRSWLISSLHQIYSRRYLLRRSALELFMVDRSNFFFDFGSTEGRRNAYRALVQARPPHLNNIYLATQRPEQLLKRTQLMERWARWEISNFEYLMQLNTLSGRSYNDITQYPVFPWVLSDYSSKTLDLANPSSYRDLSKPIGALNSDRLKKYQERYSSFDDPVIPKFHYGSHYSSAGTVLYYLARVEPFTTLSIQLQGGKFDHADRMFSDITATWNGVLEDMSDVKELVPELFYLPEVLTNENMIDFGTTQLGEKLDLVKLPSWAENPVDFIQKHRKALESEHVSAHLHEWIDLIFGYKQRGKEAILANNVFFYITYEGTVDIDKITDPVQQRATQDQIAYFGQTPSQLLTVPHMKRMPLADVLHLQTIFRNPEAVKPYVVPFPERCNLPAAAMHPSSDALVIVDVTAPAAHIAMHKWQPNTPDGQGAPFLFQHGKPSASSTAGGFMRMFKGPSGSGVEELHFPQALAYPTSGVRSAAIVAITCDKEIITGGHVDNSIRLVSVDGAKTLEIARGHCAPVTCVALSPDNNYLVTGSRDATVLVWRLHKVSMTSSHSAAELSATPSTPPSAGGTSASSSTGKGSRRRIEGPIHVLRGHLGEITCCSVSSDLGIIVSCSNSSNALIHSLRRGRLIRRLVDVEAHAICLSSDGIILAWNKLLNTLTTYTVNGIFIAKSQLPASSSVGCMEASADGGSLLVGLNPSVGSEGISEKTGIENLDLELNEERELNVPVPSICFFDLHSLKLFHTLGLRQGQDVTAMALTKDNTNLIVSTADKQLMVFTDPALSLKVVDHMLKLGWEGDGLSPLMK